MPISIASPDAVAIAALAVEDAILMWLIPPIAADVVAVGMLIDIDIDISEVMLMLEMVLSSRLVKLVPTAYLMS